MQPCPAHVAVNPQAVWHHHGAETGILMEHDQFHATGQRHGLWPHGCAVVHIPAHSESFCRNHLACNQRRSVNRDACSRTAVKVNGGLGPPGWIGIVHQGHQERVECKAIKIDRHGCIRHRILGRGLQPFRRHQGQLRNWRSFRRMLRRDGRDGESQQQGRGGEAAQPELEVQIG